MKNLDSKVVENALMAFQNNKVMTLEDLKTLLCCSMITVRRRLKDWQTFTSYNQNGRYYTLPHIPKFDTHGLWHYRHISFSQHGNLKQTIVHLVENSEQGLSAWSIEKLLGFAVHPLLPRLAKDIVLCREKIQGKFIYFSSDKAVSDKQISSYKAFAFNEKQTDLPCHIAVQVLVERIKHPDVDWAQLVKRLQIRGVQVSLPEVISFLKFYGVEKKTTDSH